MKDYYIEKGFNVKIYTKKNLSINKSLIEQDFFILKSKQLHFLYAGYFLEANNVPVIPNTDISFKCKNRIEASFLLKTIGLNIPQIFLGVSKTLKAKLKNSVYPLISKPIMGSGSKEVKLIKSIEDFGVDDFKLFYVEKFIVGIHYLVYFINDNICVCEKTPLLNEHASVRLIDTPPEIKNIILKWKNNYNFLFGHLDIVRAEKSNKLYVVDQGNFPEFSNWRSNDDPVSKICNSILKRYNSIKS